MPSMPWPAAMPCTHLWSAYARADRLRSSGLFDLEFPALATHELEDESGDKGETEDHADGDAGFSAAAEAAGLFVVVAAIDIGRRFLWEMGFLGTLYGTAPSRQEDTPFGPPGASIDKYQEICIITCITFM
ncbi:hypothetical protein MKZ38_003781 [Zalerion maritima]|uniref:Uncharacterized protein n=1 Tax=Zalerion maritima TaxID=339359 RepID=A0AAD5WS61_9PEZI|nr:hypothetical protein MKZ38_003781 [Zalerion maritima]